MLRREGTEIKTRFSVTTARLNEAVKRKAERFPQDFMFRLSATEQGALISQIATAKPGRRGRSPMPRWSDTGESRRDPCHVLSLKAAHFELKRGGHA